jgi:hypothetical protein
MHFPSLFFSAAALLARTASGYYLLKSTHPELSYLGFAKIRFGPDQVFGGFYSGEGNPYASFTLSAGASGDLDSFVLRKDEDGEWSLISRLGTSVEVQNSPTPG